MLILHPERVIPESYVADRAAHSFTRLCYTNDAPFVTTLARMATDVEWVVYTANH